MTVPPVGQPIETINQMIQMARQYILDAPDSEDGAEMQAILDNLKELIADVDDVADNSEDQSPADAMPATAASSPSENRSRPRAGQVETRSSDTLNIADKRIRGLVPYGVQSRDMGGWREVIDNTAFRNTDFSELRAVIDHKGTPLARYPKTLELEDRSDGLAWSIDPPQSRADVVEAVQRGDMNSGSWRMKVAKDRWDGEVRHVQEISHLYDVTLVGAELPAYPSAAVEYRSQPAPGQEEPIMADQAEDRSGLEVESVEVLPTKRDLFQELAVASRETHPGEIRSLTTAVSLGTPEYSVQFFDVLRPTSAFLRSGVRTISTSNEAVIFPYLTADSTIGWVSEGGTITASDPTLAAGTATPHKLAVRVEYSNELAEDSSPALETVLRQALVARAGVQVDVAAYQGSGAAPTPTGMGNVAGIGNVSAAAANTNIAWAGSAIAFLESGYAPRPYVYVGGTSLAKDIRAIKAGTAYDPYLFPVGSEALPSLYGAEGFLAPALAAGTAYFYSPSSCFVVNRTQAFDVEVNRMRLFDSDRSEMRLKARMDFLFPYSAAICRGTAVP
jgi:HK97 family phage major capsid protein/HK97 family phage prohead protease